MDLCGNVYATKDFSKFSLKCSKCEENLLEWVDFVKHIRHCILPTLSDEPYIDVPSESKSEYELGFDIIEPQIIKQEEEFVACSVAEEVAINNYDIQNQIFKNEFEDETKAEPFNTVDPSEEEATASTTVGDNLFEDDFFDCSSSSDESYTSKKKITCKDGGKFTPSFYRHSRCTSFFIELYKNQPCLWDENSANFKNAPARKLAYKTMIKSIKKSFQSVLNESLIKGFITKIRQQYYAVQENIKEDSNVKIKPLVLEYYKQCSFLGEIDESKAGELKFMNAGFKVKCQVFSNFRKEVRDALIDLYAANTVLHDVNHPEYTSNLKRGAALNSIVEILKRDYDLKLTVERLSTLIRSLRDWYNKISARKRKGETLSEEELFYLERCSFFPPKVKKQKFTCHLCQTVYMSDNALQSHMVEVHQIGEMPHKCEECNRFFRQRSSLLLHNQRSHSAKRLECEYCHRKFSVLADYRLHVRTHTEEKPYICELCGKAFRIRTQLNYHTTAIHTKIRAFKCNLCPKDFLKAVHLRDHIKSHLNIRDKICETCGKGFTNCHSLIRHRQIHSAVKKFECKLCDAKFHQFVGLNSHMKRTHNIVKNKPKA